MPRITLPISNGFYNSDSLPVSHQECINWRPNIVQTEGALSPETLIGTSGITQITTTGAVNQANRGAHVKDGKPYFLNGETLIRLDKSVDGAGAITYTQVVLGTIPGTGDVSMADNGTQLMILVPGGNGYIMNEAAGTPFLQITDGDFTASGNPQYVVFIDSYFVCTTDTKKFIKSASNDGLSWNALDFSSAEADPDTIVAPITHRNRLYIAGSETIEDFINQPSGADFPFVRGGLVLNKGVTSPLSLLDTGDTFLFVGAGTNESPAIWALSGNSVQKVSTTAIDVLLNDLTSAEAQAIVSFNDSSNGGYFVYFRLPKTTIVYNTTTGRWHEQKSIIVNNLGLAETISWRVSRVVTAYGLRLCGDIIDGRIGSIEPDTYTEYSELIHRSFTTQPFSDQGNVLTVSALELTMQSGSGDFTTLDPKINMSQSFDNRTFNDEIPRSIGAIGEYDQRLIWYRLGRVPRFTSFKFAMSDPVNPTVIKLEGNVRGHQIGS